MKEPNEIDLLFQNGLDGLAFSPDPYVKENIDHAIASKKKRRRFLFIFFPVLFGLAGFAAIGLFYQNEPTVDQPQPIAMAQKKQNPKQAFSRFGLNENEDQSKLLSEGKPGQFKNNEVYTANGSLSSKHIALNNSGSQTHFKRKAKITGNNIQTTSSTKLVKSTYRLKTKTATSSSDQSASPAKQLTNEAGLEPSRQLILADNTSQKPVDKIPDEEETGVLAVNKPDSIITPLPDSASMAVSEALNHVGSNKGAGKWSLSVLTYWEGEKRRKNDLNEVPFINSKRETGRFHTSTFYVKTEIAYRLNTNLEILSGIGFRTSKVIQYGYLSKIDPALEGTSSGVPQPINPPEVDTTSWSEKQSFRVNSIVIPIGLAYTFPITTRMNLRISGGGEFASGKITSRFVHPDLSAPKFNSFGCSVWLRPEINYSFGRTQLFGFGTFNQSLSQQLKWNIDSRRNPAFGAGIGLRIQL